MTVTANNASAVSPNPLRDNVWEEAHRIMSDDEAVKTADRVRAAVASRISTEGDCDIRIGRRSLAVLFADMGALVDAYSMLEGEVEFYEVPARVLQVMIRVPSGAVLL